VLIKRDPVPIKRDGMANRNDEILILRECLYTLQGMNGTNLYFDQEAKLQIRNLDNSLAQNNPSQSLMGQGSNDALRLCFKAGWYYCRIQEFIMKTNSTSSSAVAKALATALQDHLLDHYHSLLANWEAKLADISSSDSKTLSLRQLLLRLREPTLQLETLALVTDGLKGIKRGSEILTALFKHAWHGDSRHVTLIQGLLQKASRPWFDALYLWTTQGTLIMDREDFFVYKTHQTKAHSLISERCHDDKNHELNWNDTFKIYEDRVPRGILDQTLVQPSLTVGKGINFIRLCLRDAGWKLDLSENTNDNEEVFSLKRGDHITEEEIKKQLWGFRYHPPKDFMEFRSSRSSGTRQASTLCRTLQLAEKQINAYIVHVLRERHHLMDHLHGLKQFLLLGQGDFISALLEGLYPVLERDHKIRLHKFSLMGYIDNALKSTNAIQLPSWVLERLSVKLFDEEETSPPSRFQLSLQSEKDTNFWDKFALDYCVPDPLSAIVHERAMEHYHQVFSFLWSLKRVEFLLNLTWRQSTDLNHAIVTFAQYHAIHVATHQPYAQATSLLRHISMTRQSMMHFIINLKSYLFFEVLEGAWKTLRCRVEQGMSLDDLIQAHDDYLDEIVQMSLLFDEDGDTALGLHLHSLLNLALKFCTIQQNLIVVATKQVEKATELMREAERRTKQGEWGFTSPENDETERFFGLTDPYQLEQVVDISEEFHQSTEQLLTCLHEISHGKSGTLTWSSMNSFLTDNSTTMSSSAYREQINTDSLQFLTFQLDFSGYYD